jgi:capsular polysaccharide biosynthesis protein
LTASQRFDETQITINGHKNTERQQKRGDVMAQLALVDAYQSFISTASPLLNIVDEPCYNSALETLEQLLESADDNEQEPLNLLIDLLERHMVAF